MAKSVIDQEISKLERAGRAAVYLNWALLIVFAGGAVLLLLIGLVVLGGAFPFLDKNGFYNKDYAGFYVGLLTLAAGSGTIGAVRMPILADRRAKNDEIVASLRWAKKSAEDLQSKLVSYKKPSPSSPSVIDGFFEIHNPFQMIPPGSDAAEKIIEVHIRFQQFKADVTELQKRGEEGADSYVPIVKSDVEELSKALNVLLGGSNATQK